MYEHIALTDAKFVNILNACPDLYPRTMVLNGVSKAYAMTGWRIGYAAGPENIITAMENVQSQSTSNPTSISQVAAEAALNGDQGCITPMLKAFRERHVFVVNELNKIPGVKCIMAGGAFYAFPDARAAIASIAQEGRDQGSHRHGLVRIPAGGSRRGRGARLGLWQRRLYPPVVRHFDGQSGAGFAAHRESAGLIS